MKGRIIQHVTRVTKIYLLALGTTQISSFFWKVECSTYTRKQVTGAMAYMPFVRKCWDRLRIHINTQILFTFPDRVSGIICAHVSRSPGAHASINRYSSTASAWSSYIKHPCAPYSSTTDRNWQTHHKRFAHKTDRKQTRPEVRGRTAKSRKWWMTLEPLVLPAAAAAAAAAWGQRRADRWQTIPKIRCWCCRCCQQLLAVVAGGRKCRADHNDGWRSSRWFYLLLLLLLLGGNATPIDDNNSQNSLLLLPLLSTIARCRCRREKMPSWSQPNIFRDALLLLLLLGDNVSRSISGTRVSIITLYSTRVSIITLYSNSSYPGILAQK